MEAVQVVLNAHRRFDGSNQKDAHLGWTEHAIRQAWSEVCGQLASAGQSCCAEKPHRFPGVTNQERGRNTWMKPEPKFGGVTPGASGSTRSFTVSLHVCAAHKLPSTCTVTANSPQERSPSPLSLQEAVWTGVTCNDVSRPPASRTNEEGDKPRRGEEKETLKWMVELEAYLDAVEMVGVGGWYVIDVASRVPVYLPCVGVGIDTWTWGRTGRTPVAQMLGKAVVQASPYHAPSVHHETVRRETSITMTTHPRARHM